MTFACTDCSTCGKCYDKHAYCRACGSKINLLDEACPQCLEPITEEMREKAKKVYLDKKRAEHQQILALAAAAKARRKKDAKPKPVYPWDNPQ